MTAVVVLAALAGWYTARFVRARRDLADVKAKVPVARRILAAERRAFAVVAGIVVLTVWWWLSSHS